MHGFITTLATLLPLAAAAPFGLSDRDSNPGCQDASFNNFEWTIEKFQYNGSWVFSTPAHQIDNGIVSFNLTNPALTYVTVCEASSTQLEDFFYGTINYNCTEPEGSLTRTTFNYSTANTVLNINQTWTCSDKDPQYPTTINAYGTIDLNVACEDESWQNSNWTIGQIYSSRSRTCTTPDVQLKPYQMSAVA